jgi:hypothetical protein
MSCKKIYSLVFFVLMSCNQITYAASAIYYSNSIGETFRKTKMNDLDLAIKIAKNACEKKASDCKLLSFSYEAGYGAIVVGDKAIATSVAAKTKQDAITRALKNCSSKSPNCELIVTFHDPISAPPPQQAQTCYGSYGTGPCHVGADASGRDIYTGKFMNQP